MKRLLYIWVLIVAATFLSCEDRLDTNPSDKVSGTLIFGSADAAKVAVNGIYRAMYMYGWSDNWAHENPGILSLTLVKDLHGEDHVMASQGQGWFFYDYMFAVDSDYSTTSGRQYSQWSLFYTLISQANYIIHATEELISYGSEGIDILAQAYAIRGFSYTCLYEWYCKGNYPQNYTSPGVPVYTDATSAETVGQPRGTVEELFVRINEDFETAVDLFKEADLDANENSNVCIDIYSAYGLWARVAQIQENWDKASEYAVAALAKPGIKRVSTISELGEFNNCKTPSVLWGFVVITDQTSPFGPYLSHMDPEGGYGTVAPQCIDAWLWNAIPDTDLRKTTWWEDPANATYYRYAQLKFRYSDISTYLGDVIYLRAEELLLIAAEAACRKNDYTTARSLLTELGTERNDEYAQELLRRTDSSTYATDTHQTPLTLMDEILFQRRVELWSEGLGRAFDLRRLNLGFDRNYDGTNHPTSALVSLVPGDNRYVTLIPQKELDSNEAMDITDQNPR